MDLFIRDTIGKIMCLFHTCWLENSNLNVIRLKFMDKAFGLATKLLKTHYQKTLIFNNYIFKSLVVKMWEKFYFVPQLIISL